ncbi:MAG: type II secretion system protein [Gemmatimonadota bacterium]
MKRGFTLVEVIVALTIAGLIALAARAAVVGGLDTQDRLTRHTDAAQSQIRFRALLVGALRHLSDAPVPNQPPFVVRDTVHNDVQSHVTEFYSRGFGYPAGTGDVVKVRLAPEAGGLTLSVESLGGAPLFRGTLSTITGVRLRARAPSGEWTASWPPTLQVPSAVEFTFAGDRDPAGAPPLVVTTQLEERP